jgi:membrane protease YdiL (CAAX protease family)
MWTAEFRRYVEPARDRPQLWRLVTGVLLTFGVYFLGVVAIVAAVWLAVGDAGLTGWMERIPTGDTPTALILLLVTFLGMMIGPMIAVRLLHGRPAFSLFGPRLVYGFVVGAVISGAVFALSYLLPVPFEPVPNTAPQLFLTFLPLALVGLLIQTGAEEVLFRGYLQQQLAARFQSWIVWMLVPAVLFGALHWHPANAGPNAIWLVAAATLFGVVAADLTRATGSIGAAWGVHFVNNAAAMLIMSLNGSLSGLSLWTTPFTATNTTILRPLIALDMLTTVIVWALIRLWLARRRADRAGA